MNLKTTTLAAALCLAFAPALHAAGEASGTMTQGGSSSMSAGSGSMAHDQETVRKVQQELADKGHNPGMVDGMMGQQTKQALMDYQQAQGMPATGTLDQKTMDSLGVASTSGSMSGGASTMNPNAASPNRSGSGAPAGNDKPTSPTPDIKAGSDSGSMSSGSGSSMSGNMSEGATSGSAGGGSASGGSDTNVSPNKSGSGSPSGSDKPTAPTTR